MIYGILAAEVVWNLGLFTLCFLGLKGQRLELPAMLSGHLAVVIFAQRRAICVVSDIKKRVGFFHEKSTTGCGREIQKTSGYACR
jgi:hypothetical protein